MFLNGDIDIEIYMHLKMEFELMNLGKNHLRFNLKFKRCSNGILVYKSNYTSKVLPFEYTYDLLYAICK